MKFFFISLIIVLLIACNQSDSGKSTSSKPDSVVHSNTNISAQKNETVIFYDSALILHSKSILNIIRNNNLASLSIYIDRIRFSPYAYVDTVKDKVFTAAEFEQYANKPTKFTWGHTDGEGNPIVLNIKDYFKKYVYDQDFINAPEISVNKYLGFGNSLNNLKEVYPGHDFTEFYFRGFDPKFEGMDWRTLRLVFKKVDGKPILVAIIHDQWTI